jgi:hypothetical protein
MPMPVQSSLFLVGALGLSSVAAGAEGPWLEVDQRAFVSSADLVYAAPASRSPEGLPIGNGRMGTLVWTAPAAVCLQVNRGDVFAVNKTHAGTFVDRVEQQWGACAQVSLDLGGEPLAAGKASAQRLSLYSAEVTLAGQDVSVRCFVSSAMDVLALEIDERRAEPQPLRLTLSMWRAPEVVAGNHVSRYAFSTPAGSVQVVQRYREGDYHCASAVAARFVGENAEVQTPGETSRVLVVPAKQGKRTLLLSSAASWTAGADVGSTAASLLAAAAGRTYDELLQEHARWWHGFWSRTFVHVASADGLAEFMQRVRYLHLYYLASTSRGPLPAKWNGSLFITDGDARRWGSQFWVWTTEMPYFPLLAADATDLAEPFFDMYVRQLPDCEKAARQRWAAAGAFFPETTPFDGPVVLPDELVAEYRDIFTGRRDPKSISPQLKAASGFESHLFCAMQAATTKQYTWISHVASSGSEVAVHAWWHYRTTGDMAWLRSHAYPLLRGSAEFYRHLLRKGPDGRYHLHGTNGHEDFWGVTDSIMDLAAIRGVVPLAIRAAELLDVDADLRAAWQGLLANLAPYPMGADPQAKALRDGVLADDVWAAGHLGEVNDGHRNSEDVWLNPVFPFEDWTLETRSAATDAIVQRVLDLAHRHRAVVSGEGLNTAIRSPIAAARAGRGADLPAILASYWAAFSPLPNGLSLFEGPNDPSVEHLGLLSMTLQEALLQSVSPHPGEPEVISVFPAWPAAWSASFRLLARGGFLVTAARGAGGVELVGIESRLGEVCRLRNPWGQACVVTEEGSGSATTVSGDILVFPTAKGGRYQVLPETAPPPAPRHVPPPGPALPDHFSFTLANGKAVEGRLGVGR